MVPKSYLPLHIFSRTSSAIFNFASLLIRGQLIKDRICSHRSKVFPLRVDPILEWFCCPRKRTRSHKSCSLFKNSSKTWARLFRTNDVVSYRVVKISNVNISKKPIFFVEKMCEAFALQKLLSFFQQKISVYSVIKS